MYERAKKVIPAGVTRELRFFEPYPFYVRKALGSRVYDVDGNEYLDYWMGHAALVLGHMHPVIVDAVREQIELGFHFGYAHEWEVEFAEEVISAVPGIEMVRFVNSGTEANIHAIRLARAYTGRIKIAKIEGGWHGVCDPLDAAVRPPYEEPESAGISPAVGQEVVAIPYNDIEAAEKAAKSEELAAIIVEPVLRGAIPAEREYLKGLREICDRTGTILIFDEVITGFRMALGGGQEYYGVMPDITTLGKAAGGGEFPIGVFGGRRDIMELMDHTKRGHKSEYVKQGGTYSGNPLVMRAGVAAIREYKKEYVYNHINKLGEKLMRELDDLIGRFNVNASVTGVGSMVKLHFVGKPPKNAGEAASRKEEEKRYFSHLLYQGILAMTPSSPRFFISLPHTEEDVERTVIATEGYFKTINK